MKNFKLALAAVAAMAVLPLTANAAFVLDSGVPDGSGFPTSLDGNDFVAAEFSLGAGQTITGIQAYLTNDGGLATAGDTFTVALYADDGTFATRNQSAAVFAAQATYTADGWNGLTNITDPTIAGLAAGNYWAAFEVQEFNNGDTLAGLTVPTTSAGAGTVPALGYAFSANGGGYETDGQPFGVQVEVAPVPVPGALLLLGSGLAGVGGLLRRRTLSV